MSQSLVRRILAASVLSLVAVASAAQAAQAVLAQAPAQTPLTQLVP